jgi:hypothetical protein
MFPEANKTQQVVETVSFPKLSNSVTGAGHDASCPDEILLVFCRVWVWAQYLQKYLQSSSSGVFRH